MLMIRGIALPMKRFNINTAAQWSKLAVLPIIRIRHHSHSNSNSRSNRIFLSTAVKEQLSVPLTLTDVHLRHEQLPFAYAFRATLDPDQLISSLSEVLCRYPILGATVDFASGKVPTLECNVDDTVPMSFGKSQSTLDQWLVEKRSGKMQHVSWQSGGGAPTLSPLFDDLLSAKWDHDSDNENENEKSGSRDNGISIPIVAKEHNIATVRITTFSGGGTAIGINMSHLLGDANSCFRICQVWGQAMRGLAHPMGASNARAEATLTGMVTIEMASLLNLHAEGASPSLDAEQTFYSIFTSYFGGFISNSNEMTESMTVTGVDTDNISGDYIKPDVNGHQYVRLEFSRDLLHAMKTFGMIHCTPSHHLHVPPNNNSDDTYALGLDDNMTEFVSTNDMITAMGWMMKRHITGRYEWNLSMVVNLRSRKGIDGFGCLEDPNIGTGVFGNALTSVVAKLPPSIEKDVISLSDICFAAAAIRKSLTEKMANVQDLQMTSRLGTAIQVPDQGSCFSSTSWMQFPLWDISFGDDEQQQSGQLSGFYGRPSYPLPLGDTYSSITVPSRCGGCTFKLLAPTRQVHSILTLHQNISRQFLEWADEKARL